MEEKVKELYKRYIDACAMCSKYNCDVCYLDMFIKDLEEILGISYEI